MAPEKASRLRLNQFLARSGAGSRRGAEDLIREGRVTVNGQTVTDLATLVDPSRDSVKVDGQRLHPSERTSCYALYKPKEVVSTLEDPEGRPCLRGLMPRDARGLFPVGRLDYHSEGLLLLTNDGDLGFRLLHPRFKVAKVYQVKVKGSPSPEALNRLRRGVVLEGRRTLPVDIRRMPSRETHHTWLEITMMEGRKNQLREMFFRIEHPVIKLKRVAMGPVRLGKMNPGEVRALSPEELTALREAASGAGNREPGTPPARPRGPGRARPAGGDRRPDAKPGRPPGPRDAGAHGHSKPGGPPRKGPQRWSPDQPASFPDQPGRAARSRDGAAHRDSKPGGPSRKGPPRGSSGRPASFPDRSGRPPRPGDAGARRRSKPGGPPRKGAPTRKPRGRPSGKPTHTKEPRP